MTKAKELDFEASLNELETIVKELDSEIKLERALELFEKGMKLSSGCKQILSKAEQKIEVLKRQADNQLKLEPFSEQAASE